MLRVLVANVLFLSFFRAGWCLLVAGSVSTDLNVWERMASPSVSQAVCHAATTASVVSLLALDFIFARCLSPCPGILILDVVQARSLLDWSHTGAFDFSRLCLYQHWYWGNLSNPIQASENIVIPQTNECTSSFFRPTPYGFRQVVQHVSNHVACEINYLIHAGAKL